MCDPFSDLARSGHSCFLTGLQGLFQIEYLDPVLGEGVMNFSDRIEGKFIQGPIELFRKPHKGTDDVVCLTKRDAFPNQIVDNIGRKQCRIADRRSAAVIVDLDAR